MLSTLLLSNPDIDIYFSQDQFEGKENEQNIEIILEKSKRIATPVTMKITPMSVEEVVPAHYLNASSESVCPLSCTCDCPINLQAGM